jgi:hypothetical protein
MDIYCQDNKTKPKKPEAEKLGAESVDSIWRRTSFQQTEYEAIGAARRRSKRRLHGQGNQNAKFQESLPVDYQPGDSRSGSQNRELHVPVCISVHTTSSINSSTSSSLRAIVRKRHSANCERNCQQLRGRVMSPDVGCVLPHFLDALSNRRSPEPPSPLTGRRLLSRSHSSIIIPSVFGTQVIVAVPIRLHALTRRLLSRSHSLWSPADWGSLWYIFCLRKFFRQLFTISIGNAKSASLVDRSKVGKGRNQFFRRLCLFFLRSVIVRSSKSLSYW